MNLLTASLIALLLPGNCYKDCRTDAAGISMIQHFEGYQPFAYDDVIGVQTVGFGHAIRHGETIKQPLLPPDAQKLLESDLKPKEKAINRMVSVRLKHSQFDALSSFVFNLGEGSLKRSNLLKKVNTNKDTKNEFLKWDKAGGKEIKGLHYRRQTEAELYAR